MSLLTPAESSKSTRKTTLRFSWKCKLQSGVWNISQHISEGATLLFFSNYKSLKKLGKVHTRTLNWLQEAMNSYDFEIIYKKGSKMPADFLSRNVIDSISWNNQQMQQEQTKDPIIKADHFQTCTKCQLGRTDHPPPPALLTLPPQPTELNMQIHAYLFGPLRDMGRNKKYILTITDPFTNYVELVALPYKEAPTVCEAIFNRWICRYSVPIKIVTDQGGEFCNELSAELYKLLQTSHLHTLSRHPACNSQAKVVNKTIAKYLRNLVRDDTLDWEQYLCPLMFSYNTSFHRSIKTTPFFIMFGIEPRLPAFPGQDLCRKYYGESTSAQLHQRLLYARDIARRNNKNSTEEREEDFNKKAQLHNYQIEQLVLLDEHSFLHKNTKLALKWSGPHRILHFKGPVKVELLLKDKKKHLLVHVNWIKPYLVPQKSKIDFNEVLKNSQIPPPPLQIFLSTVRCAPKHQYLYCNQRQCRRHQRHLYVTPHNLAITSRHCRHLLCNSRPPLLLLFLNNNNKLRNEKEEDRKNQLNLLLNFLLCKCLMTCVQGHKFDKQIYLKNLLTLASPPAQEGGGIEEQNAINPLQNKKRQKRSSEAWKKIQQRNYAFSSDTYILQSHRNDVIPIQEVEQEEPAELFSSSEEEEENIQDFE